MNANLVNKLKGFAEKAVKEASPIVKKEIANTVSKSASNTVSSAIKLGCAGLMAYVIFGGVTKAPVKALASNEEELMKAMQFTYNKVDVVINYLLKGEN